MNAGYALADYQDRMYRDLPCTRIEADEVWCFAYARSKTATANPEASDVWLWAELSDRPLLWQSG